MGACFSRSESGDPSQTAKVISINGELHEYTVPIDVSQVLQSETPPPSSSLLSSGFFLCNSDRLYYEQCIPALAPGEELVGNQIYFVLPDSKLNRRLMAPEMAALAVKASLALQKAGEKGCGGGRKKRRIVRGKASMSQISPVLEICQVGSYDSVVMDSGYSERNSNGRGISGGYGGNKRGVARMGSFRRPSRLSSLKGGKAVTGSLFRMSLSTIHEGIMM